MARITITALLIILLGGCYYDLETTLYPDTNCTPPTSSTFAADVLPLLNTYCNGCHSGTYASAGIRLDQFDYVKAYVNNGKLMGSVNWTSGYSPMPKNGGKLSSCNIDKINIWINSGALNN